jgi:HD-like signal output (HDOD) protein/prolyl-tRNA editing enzyme YbaK/EbsC (Cys-tRNA(Pro) deacylase)
LSILEVFETNQIAYQVKASVAKFPTARTAPNRAAQTCVVKSLILQDARGKLLVLLPADYILDLAAIKSQFGRNLDSLSKQELAPMLAQQGLRVPPAMPEWQGLTTIVDASLLRHPFLLLDMGDKDELLEIKLVDFQSIIKSTCIGEIAIPAPQVPDSAEMDKEQIVHSLKNFTQLRIKQRLEDTLELPPLPETAQRIIKLRADPEADISDLSNIIELDPSLAAQVVSWASSPYYSAPGKIKSVHDAIVRVLGFDMVLNLALGLALGRTMNREAMSNAQLKTYWQNAVCTAAAVEGLVTAIPREHRPGFGMAYLSGLLNNFGELILAEVFPPYYANLTRHFDVNSHLPAASVEQQLIGVSSCQISSWLMSIWNMPQEVVIAMRQQNNPDYQGELQAYPKLLLVARQLLINNGYSKGIYQELPESVFEDLHLDPENAQLTVENILESAADLEAIAEKIQG